MLENVPPCAVKEAVLLEICSAENKMNSCKGN